MSEDVVSSALMKYLTFLVLFSLSSCASKSGYRAGSVGEAKAYAKRAVEVGVTHKGNETELANEKSIGKPQEGKWKPEKIERFVAEWVEKNPRRAEINLAASKGVISERDRFLLISDLDMMEAAMAQQKAAKMQAIAAGLNAASASINQSAAVMNQNTAAMNQSTARTLSTPSYQYQPYQPTPIYRPSTINLRPTYGGGYSGTIY